MKMLWVFCLLQVLVLLFVMVLVPVLGPNPVIFLFSALVLVPVPSYFWSWPWFWSRSLHIYGPGLGPGPGPCQNFWSRHTVDEVYWRIVVWCIAGLYKATFIILSTCTVCSYILVLYFNHHTFYCVQMSHSLSAHIHAM